MAKEDCYKKRNVEGELQGIGLETFELEITSPLICSS